jgi:UDP-2-acetamido-2,6-beta-L-arabino-hexul-4-ose reductase
MESVQLQEFDIETPPSDLMRALSQAELIFHLAGVNRPQRKEELRLGNTGFTEEICNILRELGRTPKIVFSSSIQAELSNPYGISKRGAEESLRRLAEETSIECVVYRFKNLFGKWCRPNYNSVTATFCYNIAHSLPIHISDSSRKVELTYIDDVVEAFLSELQIGPPNYRLASPLPGTWVTLGQLAEKIQSFRELRFSLRLPEFDSAFERALYATYLSYLESEDFVYSLDVKADQRGSLAEFLKSPSMGQIFISRTRPGVTRGNHFHHTKTEKFLVMQGTAIIRFRHIERNDIIEHHVKGSEYCILDIPPGYTHSIENVGQEELVTLFWASEMFDPKRPDTFFEPVLKS